MSVKSVSNDNDGLAQWQLQRELRASLGGSAATRGGGAVSTDAAGPAAGALPRGSPDWRRTAKAAATTLIIELQRFVAHLQAANDAGTPTGTTATANAPAALPAGTASTAGNADATPAQATQAGQTQGGDSLATLIADLQSFLGLLQTGRPGPSGVAAAGPAPWEPWAGRGGGIRRHHHGHHDHHNDDNDSGSATTDQLLSDILDAIESYASQSNPPPPTPTLATSVTA